MVLNERKVFISAPPPKKNGAKITFVWPNVKLGDVKYHNEYTLLREQEENAHTVWGKFCFHINIFVSLYLNFSLDKKINATFFQIVSLNALQCCRSLNLYYQIYKYVKS